MTDRFEIDVATGCLPAAHRKAGDAGDDRVATLPAWPVCLVLADGASGGEGAKAADAFVADVSGSALVDKDDALFYAQALDEADMAVVGRVQGRGDTTGIMLASDGARIWGASAGDSAAILFGAKDVVLTAWQVRKPRIGAGSVPVAFGHVLDGPATLVVASDGLWDFAGLDDIRAAAKEDGSADEVLRSLQALAARRDGGLADDLAMAVVRFTVPAATSEEDVLR